MSNDPDDEGAVNNDDFEEQLDTALANYLERSDRDPSLLPGTFCEGLPETLRAAFLAELEQLGAVDRLAMAPPRDIPHRFGAYRILRKLGEGGAGVVYEAEDVPNQRRVALKVLHASAAGDMRSIARFEREARTAASLEHPGIVPIHEFGSHDNCAYLAMGLLEGHSLQRLLEADRDKRDIDHAVARSWLEDPMRLAAAFADVADALEFAHRRNVIHRDIKPANLMAGTDGITILDYGLATSRDDDSRLTRTGDFLGTPAYMSPEQVVGREIGSRSDIYSLGAVLYECLTGRRPSAALALPDMLDQIRSAEVVNPRRLVPDVPAGIANIVVRCLEKKPARRYRSAAELADDLRRFASGDPVCASGVGPTGRLLRRAGRRPGLYAGAALLLVVALGSLGFGWLQYHETRVEHLEAELREVPKVLALSPEGLTVFGGASRRWFETVGLGNHLPAPELAVSPAAASAEQRAQELVREYPDDIRTHRLLVRVLMDVGRDSAASRAACERLLKLPAANAADRALKALLDFVDGDEQACNAAFAALADEDSGEVEFFRGLLHQLHHRYWQAIESFSNALADQRLTTDHRYFAFLHRGWCRTRPEVAQLRQSEDDLLRAATLRPNYGTPLLLWAGLRCLDPSDSALNDAVQTVTKVLTVVDNEPWVVLLTARVLLEFAESSSRLAGPTRFSRGLCPLVALPIEAPRKTALAQTALALIDVVHNAAPELIEPVIHRVGALAVLGRIDDALATAAQLTATDPALALMLKSRVHLAAGKAGAARDTLQQVLVIDPGLATAHLLSADLAAHVGDARGELRALRIAAAALPSWSPELPRIQVRGAETCLRIGDYPAAIEWLEAQFGGKLAGSQAPRAQAERAVLRLVALRGINEDSGRLTEQFLATKQLILDDLAPQPDNPLRGLLSRLVPLATDLTDADAANAMMQTAMASAQDSWWRLLVMRERGWLSVPAQTESDTWQRVLAKAPISHSGVVAAVARSDRELGQFGDAVQKLRSLATEAQEAAHLATLAALENGSGNADASFAVLETLNKSLDPSCLPALIRETLSASLSEAWSERMLMLADQLGAEAGNDAAKVLKAVALEQLGRHEDLAEFLGPVDADSPQDLRLIYFRARSLIASGDFIGARQALSTSKNMGVGELRYVERSLGVPGARSVAETLANLLE